MQAPPTSNQHLSTDPPLENPGGEGWLANLDQLKIVQFKLGTASAH